MTSAGDARTFCEEAVAKVVAKYDNRPEEWADFLNDARAVLDLLLGSPDGAVSPLRRPCPTCGGRREAKHRECRQDIGMGCPHDPVPCNDCSDGFRSLAAIDEARHKELSPQDEEQA